MTRQADVEKGAGVNKKKLLLMLQSVLCIVLSVMIAAAVIGIYRDGLALKAADPLSWIFTPEKVIKAFMPILPLLVLSLVLTCVGLVMGIRDENGDRPVQDTQILRNLTAARVAVPGIEMKQEQLQQKRLHYGSWVLFALCMVPVLLYISNGNHFPNGDLEMMFLALAGHVLPWTALGMASLMISSVLQEKSMKREIEAAKEQIRLNQVQGRRPVVNKTEKKTRGNVRMLRGALLVLALVLIAAGVLNGSAMDVFGKAIKICTECVGLG